MRDNGWTAYPSGHHEAGGWASAANVPTANVPTSAKTAHVTFSISVGVRGKNKILNTLEEFYCKHVRRQLVTRRAFSGTRIAPGIIQSVK